VAGTSSGDDAPPGTPGAGEHICPACQGTGRLGRKRCTTCGGTGRVIEVPEP
jgi:DnaJ-class molecular chaperone